MKKVLSLVMALLMLLSMAACSGGNKTESSTPSDTTSENNTSSGDSETTTDSEESTTSTAIDSDFEGKIGIMVCTVAVSEEEYRTAEYWKDTLGEDKVVIQTYPDNFMKEQETTISNMLALVSDPEIKAVVFCQGVPGATAAIEKAKEKRPDILYINGAPNEDPPLTAPAADVVIDMDWINNAQQMMDRAKEMGAETVIGYSFPRLQGYAKNAYAVSAAEAYCKEIGLEWVYVTMPDPMSDAGQAGTQQFCREDVPKQLEKYGPNTAFWDFNTYSSPAVIKALLDAGEGIYMNSSQGSPFQGYPEAFNIDVPSDKKGDSAWMVEQLQAFCAENGASGRFSVRAFPVNMGCMNVGVAYSVRYLKGQTDGKVDEDVLREVYAEVTGQTMDEISFTKYEHPETGETYDNYFMILAPWAML